MPLPDPPSGYTIQAPPTQPLPPPPGGYTLEGATPGEVTAPKSNDSFFGGVGDALKGAWDATQAVGEHAKSAVESFKQGNYTDAALHTLKSLVGPGYDTIVQPAIDQALQAKKLAEAGRYSEAAGHGLAAITPGVGPMVAQTAETAMGEPVMPPVTTPITKPTSKSKTSLGGPQVVGQQAQPEVAAPREAQPMRALGQLSTGAALGAAADLGAKGVNRYSAAVNEAVAGAPHEILQKTNLVPKQGIKDLPNTMEHIATASSVPIDRVARYADALENLRKSTLDKMEQWYYGPARAMGAQVDATPLIQDTIKRFPRGADEGEYDGRIQQLQNQYQGRTYTTDDLHHRLTYLNAASDALHNGDAITQGTAAMKGTTPAMLDAEADAVRSMLYPAIDLAPAPGTIPGEGPTQAGGILADTLRLQKQYERQKQNILKEKPSSPTEAIAKQAAAVGDIATTPFHGNIYDAIKGPEKALHGVTDPMVKQAFAKVGPVSKPLVNPGIGMNRLGMPGMPGAGYPAQNFSPYPQAPQGFANVGHPLTPQGPPQLGPPSVPVGVSGVTMPGSNASNLRTQVASQPPRLGGASPGMPLPNAAGPFTAGAPGPEGSTVTGPGQRPPMPQLGGPTQIQQPGDVMVPQNTAVDRARGEGPPKATHVPGVSNEMIQVKDSQTGQVLWATREDAARNPSYKPLENSMAKRLVPPRNKGAFFAPTKTKPWLGPALPDAAVPERDIPPAPEGGQ